MCFPVEGVDVAEVGKSSISIAAFIFAHKTLYSCRTCNAGAVHSNARASWLQINSTILHFMATIIFNVSIVRHFSRRRRTKNAINKGRDAGISFNGDVLLIIGWSGSGIVWIKFHPLFIELAIFFFGFSIFAERTRWMSVGQIFRRPFFIFYSYEWKWPRKLWVASKNIRNRVNSCCAFNFTHVKPLIFPKLWRIINNHG